MWSTPRFVAVDLAIERDPFRAKFSLVQGNYFEIQNCNYTYTAFLKALGVLITTKLLIKLSIETSNVKTGMGRPMYLWSHFLVACRHVSTTKSLADISLWTSEPSADFQDWDCRSLPSVWPILKSKHQNILDKLVFKYQDSRIRVLKQMNA